MSDTSDSTPPTLRHRVFDRLRAWLVHRWLPLHLAVLAVLLCTPSLRSGYFLDDYIHRAALLGQSGLTEERASIGELFAFIPEERGVMADLLPWWTPDDLKLSFWRPLAGATHWLDHRLWPDSPELMHLHSLLWMGLTTWLATVFYRRVLAGESAWVGGLAALFFAVDDAHAWPAMWIANRNALVSATFGLAAMIAHDRRRRDGWRPGAWWAPALLLLAVLGAESAVACGGYLVAYALFLDTGPMRGRLAALLPSALVGVGWLLVYRLQGFGTRGSSAYLDPLAQPLEFLAGWVERAPILLLGLWSPLPADFYTQGSSEGRAMLWGVGVGLVLLMTLLLFPVARRDRRVAFCALGTAASLVPASVIFPMNRQLLYPGVGAVALVALLIAAALRDGQGKVWRWSARGVSVLALGFHLLFAPLALLATPKVFGGFSRMLERSFSSLPTDPAIAHQRLVIVHVPGQIFTSSAHIMQHLEGHPVARDQLVLSSGIWPVEIERLDAQSLAVRPAEGFLAPLGTTPQSEVGTAPPFDFWRVFNGYDTLLFDRHRPLKLGARFDRDGVEIEVTRLNDEGRPDEVVFRFDTPLEDDTLRWAHWRAGGFEPFALPSVGETVSLPRPSFE